MGAPDELIARFDLPVQGGQVYLSRTHPLVEGLSNYVMNTALDSLADSIARRSGVIRTRAVETRTTLLLVRMRFHILQPINGNSVPLLAEDVRVAAFEGSPAEPRWLDDRRAEELLQAEPAANIGYEQAREFIARVVADEAALEPHLVELTEQRGEVILESHVRVREAARMRGRRPRIEPNLPPDLLGIYVLLPVPQG